MIRGTSAEKPSQESKITEAEKSKDGFTWTVEFTKLIGGNSSNIFYFHPYLGKIPILTNIFQMGWNHQLEKQLDKRWGE